MYGVPKHRKSPQITAYRLSFEHSKTHCSTSTPPHMKTVLGIDRTFNLGSCYVTICVYRNMAVVRKTTLDNPIFMGPVMLHYVGRLETYKTFLRATCDALGGDVGVAEINGDVEMLFGSDEEKALVSAVREVFPVSAHVFCSRHIEENCRRYMTDVAGVPIKERETVLKCLLSLSNSR